MGLAYICKEFQTKGVFQPDSGLTSDTQQQTIEEFFSVE